MAVGEFGPSEQGNGLLLVAFCCGNSSSKAGELSKAPFLVNGVTVRLSVLACSSKLGILHVLRALERGADAVAVWTCREKACRFGRGWARAGKRVERSRRILEQIGVGGERVFLGSLEPTEGQGLAKALGEVVGKMADLGASPLKSAGGK